MFTIPLYSLLILLGIFLAVFVLFFGINVRDLIADKAFNFATLTATILVVSASLLTLGFSFSLLQDIDWKQPLIQFDREAATADFS